MLTQTSPGPPPGAGVADSLTPIMCGVGRAVVSRGARGVGIATGPSAGMSTLSFFCLFGLPTTTVGEALGAGVAFSRFDQGQNTFFLVVCCCFAGDAFTCGEGDVVGEL